MTADPTKPVLRELYGGAIKALLAADFQDVSDVRPVPDHQEVFLNAHEASVISELLDLREESGDEEAAEYYFADLASSNESAQSAVLDQRVLRDERLLPALCAHSHTPTPARMLLVGKQSVRKYKSESAPLHAVYVLLALARLRGAGTDLLLSLNLPATVLAHRGVSAEELDAGLTVELLLRAAEREGETPSEAEPEPLLEKIPELRQFMAFLQSYRVHDWSLFSPGEEQQEEQEQEQEQEQEEADEK